MDFKKIFILILSVLFFSPPYSLAMDKTSSTSEIAKNSKPDPNVQCEICSKAFSRGEKLDRLKSCGHYFHLNCISVCIGLGKDHCPICKALIGPPCDWCHKPFYLNEQKLEKKKITSDQCRHQLHYDCLCSANNGIKYDPSKDKMNTCPLCQHEEDFYLRYLYDPFDDLLS